MKDEALKLALEALDANYLLVNGTETHGGLEQCLDGYYSSCFDTDPINKQTEEAITAIKEALAQSFNPDYSTEAVLVEEMQRMAKRIEDLEATLTAKTARIVDLQTHIDNFEGENR